jgi:hypothetical protein
MNEIVQALANASLQVAVVVACTFALRWLLGDRISPVVYGWAWSVVAVRLLVPIPIRASWAVADPGALLAGSGVIDELSWRADPRTCNRSTRARPTTACSCCSGRSGW